MAKFVLVHGAFHGAWCWDRVVPLLREAGHEVWTPTQTGLGERAQLLGPGITLSTFVDDVVAVLESEGLTDVVLVGHSFGGHAIAGAADRVPGRVRSLVFLDGVFPRSLVAPLDGVLPEVAAARRAQAAERGGLSLLPPPPDSFGVPAGPDADWVRARLTPHPFGTMETAIELRAPVGNGRPCHYVFCTDPEYAPLRPARDRARQAGWTWHEIAAGHDCMVTAPRETAALLMEIAA